jgi:SAM-dependent methyltransferase
MVKTAIAQDKEMVACRLCSATDDIHVILRQKNAPRNIQRLLSKNEIADDAGRPLVVYECRSCGLVQIAAGLSGEYYDDYLMTVSHSTTMVAYQEDQARNFIGRFGLAGKPVIEIGCGDGHYLSLLARAGARAAGIEPSAAFRRAAEHLGLPIYEGYVTRGRVIEGGPFAGFAARQVLEHVGDIRDFLIGIRRNMLPGAVGLVEVPRLEKAVRDARFYDFFADHLNYFSERTLRAALEITGYEVLETLSGMNEEFNIALVRVPVGADFSVLAGAAQKTAGQIQSFIARHHNAGRRVAVWGAGGKGLTSMAEINVSGIAYVVDSDIHKQGAYTPVTHLLVRPPSALSEDLVEGVILTALAYKDEIISQLRRDLGFRGEIAVLSADLEILPAI